MINVTAEVNEIEKKYKRELKRPTILSLKGT